MPSFSADDAPGIDRGNSRQLHPQAHALGRDMRIDTAEGTGALEATSSGLAAAPASLPFSPFLRALREIGHDSRIPEELVPLVIESSSDGSFRSVVAAWAGENGPEVIDRAERLEALMGMWDGRAITPERWRAAHVVARERAEETTAKLRDRASLEEHAAIDRQLQAARERLLRELARFLASANEDGESFNVTFHRWMQRGGQTSALLSRVHGLIGYPDWDPVLHGSATEAAARLTTNQRKNLLLGTPLEAAVRDPRWATVPNPVRH